MSKAFPIKDFPEYYITDAGDVFSRQTSRNPDGNSIYTSVAKAETNLVVVISGNTKNNACFLQNVLHKITMVYE